MDNSNNIVFATIDEGKETFIYTISTFYFDISNALPSPKGQIGSVLDSRFAIFDL